MEHPLDIPPVQNLPSSADWARLQPLVKELYHDRRFTMVQVRDHLISLGYRVNTRMVRSRISQWNLQRNNQLQAMVAALRLLDPNPARWPTQDPLVLIRGRRVAMSKILQYFRRKGIRNPFHWCRSVTFDEDEPTVSLIQDGSTPSGDTSTGSSTLTESSSVASSMLPVPAPSIMGLITPSYNLTPLFTLEQRAVASMRDYCANYLGLGLIAIHQEPEVHQFTVHGRFGDRMSEGLSQMIRGGSNAFPNFRRAFDLVRPILSDCHPMSLSQLLATACELSTSVAHSIVLCLLRYAAAMAATLRTAPYLVQFLGSLSDSPPALLQHTIISSLRAAQATFLEHSPNTWHGLYIQERLCDCLYHARDRTEGSARRIELLRAQETFYSPLKRNVLWTITNVADDHLDRGDLDGAEKYYVMALERAEGISGFGRAKLRYAGLEGLGRIERIRSENIRSSNSSELQGHLSIYHLRNASRYIEEALNEASIWFEPNSRRVNRIIEQKQDIMSILQTFE